MYQSIKYLARHTHTHIVEVALSQIGFIEVLTFEINVFCVIRLDYSSSFSRLMGKIITKPIKSETIRKQDRLALYGQLTSRYKIYCELEYKCLNVYTSARRGV